MHRVARRVPARAAACIHIYIARLHKRRLRGVDHQVGRRRRLQPRGESVVAQASQLYAAQHADPDRHYGEQQQSGPRGLAEHRRARHHREREAALCQAQALRPAQRGLEQRQPRSLVLGRRLVGGLASVEPLKRGVRADRALLRDRAVASGMPTRRRPEWRRRLELRAVDLLQIPPARGAGWCSRPTLRRRRRPSRTDQRSRVSLVTDGSARGGRGH